MKRLAGLMTGVFVAIAAVDLPQACEAVDIELESELADVTAAELDSDDVDDASTGDWAAEPELASAAAELSLWHQAEEATGARDHSGDIHFPPWA